MYFSSASLSLVRSGASTMTGVSIRAAADSREFGLAMFGALSGDERVWSDRLPLPLALVPKFEEVAAFGMGLVPALDHDVVAPDAALAVEQRRRENPRTINLDLL